MYEIYNVISYLIDFNCDLWELDKKYLHLFMGLQVKLSVLDIPWRLSKGHCGLCMC